MRRLALGIVLALVLAGALVPAFAVAGSKPPAGALSVEGGKGFFIVRGDGGLLGRVAKGSVEIVDLTPTDGWRPVVNGTTRATRYSTRGSNLSLRILGGSYRVTIRGEGVSLSARGTGVATLLGVAGPFSSDTGIYSTNLEADCQDAPDQCNAVPMILTRVPFGTPTTTQP